MSEKNISDIIQNILDKNNGFVLLSKLRLSLSNEVRQQLGIKSKESISILQKKIEAVARDKIMFRKKGAKTFILTPFEPSELVLGLLSTEKPFDMKSINNLPFTKSDFIDTINALVEDGQAKITLTQDGKPQIFRADIITIGDTEPSSEKFREAFDSLDNGHIFVRICDLRRKLGWPREVFDHMLTDLRDKKIIQLHTGDVTLMTIDEINDCFVDENGFRMGSVTWHVR